MKTYWVVLDIYGRQEKYTLAAENQSHLMRMLNAAFPCFSILAIGVIDPLEAKYMSHALERRTDLNED